MKKIPVLSVKKDDKFVTFVPHLATTFVYDKPLKFIYISDKDYKNITFNIEEINKSTIHKVPTKLFVISNTDCDGRCVYCYNSKHRMKKLYLTIDDMKKAIKKEKIEEVKNVIIYGGEPFLHPERTFDIIDFIKEDLKCSKIHVVTSLFYDDNTFLKVLGFCGSRNISLTVSMDPPSKTYPRIYPKVQNVYEFLLRRLQILAETTNIIFGVRSTISDWAYDGVQQFKDVNSISNKPISINFDLIKGFPIEQRNLMFFLKTWSNYAPEVIKTLIGRTYGVIFHPTFSALLRGNFLVSIMKNCDAGRGRISILPGGKTGLCNEDVLGENKYKLRYEDIFPFNEKCNNCSFKYACGFHCFSIDRQYMDNYCLFHKYLFTESFKNFIRIKTTDEIEKWIKSQPIQLKI